MRGFSRGRGYYIDLASGERRGPGACVARGALGALSMLYEQVMRRRNRLYDLGRGVGSVEVPVISIGSITVGGTGKTVLVEDVVRRLLREGRRPVILSRGYKGAGGGNDEFKLLAENLPDVPHLTGKKRLTAAREALARHQPDVIVLDDGFTHRGIARDLDIVTIDALCPFGYGHLLPRGLLREPCDSLKRADLIVMTRSDLLSPLKREAIRRELVRLAPNIDVVKAYHKPARAVDVAQGRVVDHLTLRENKAYMFCAIGNPLGFELTLKKLAVQIVGKTIFIDHHRYSPGELRTIENDARAGGAHCLLVTQKDRVKLEEIAYNWSLPIYSVDVRMAYLSGEDKLQNKITQAVTSFLASRR